MDSNTIKMNNNHGNKNEIKENLIKVCDSMNLKGYHSKDQIIGYLVSGDPSYIPRVDNARNMIREFSREEILMELLEKYLENE